MSGSLFAIIAAVLFGLSSPFAKALLGNVDPWLLAGLLYFGSGIGMSLILFCRSIFGKASSIQKISRADVPWLFVVTFFGGVLGPIFLMYGLSQTFASTASLLLNLEGVFTAAIAWIVFKEHASHRVIVGMISIVVGGLILSWPETLSWSGLSGPLFIGLACLSWGVDNNLTRKISLNDPILLTTVKSFCAGTTNLILALCLGVTIPKILFIAEAGLLGFLCYGLSIVFFILALRHLGASRTGAYFSSAPFVGAILATVGWHEPLTGQLFVAAAFMLTGIYLHLAETHEHLHTHDELEHEHVHRHDEHHQHEHGADDPQGEPHTHKHRHKALTHSHGHFPDMHHTHSH